MTRTWHEPMTGTLHYGTDGALGVELAPDALLVDCTAPRGAPLDDPVAAVAAALVDPLEFPPLSAATVPGDRIVVALDRHVPQAPSVIAAIVHVLLESHAEPSDITILAADGPSARGEPTELVPPTARREIHVLHHDPNNTAALSYLASTSDGNRISLNRTLVDADLVLPVGTLRLDESLGYYGVHGGLFPTFSDRATIQRFRAVGATPSSAQHRRRREEVEEAAWLLGIQFTIQVAPGPGDAILNVLAGESSAVARRGRELCADAWLHHSPSRTGLVLAGIEGGGEQQTWDNFARALHAASNAVRRGGAIVLCTDLSQPPGPALQRLASGDDEEQLLRQLNREKSADALAAALLLETRRHANIYLLSGLDRETVEDLGMGYVAGPKEVAHLSHQFDSCILLGSAHLALLETPEEATSPE